MDTNKNKLEIINRTAIFSHESISTALQRYNQNQAYKWIRVIVIEGELILHTINDQHREFTLTPNKNVWIRPKDIYKIEYKSPVKFYFEYYKSMEQEQINSILNTLGSLS